MNEPKVDLRQVSTRIEIEDYAKIVQILADSSNGYRDTSDYVRKLIHKDLESVELSEGSKCWVRHEVCMAIEKRNAKRKKPTLLRRMFGGK